MYDFEWLHLISYRAFFAHKSVMEFFFTSLWVKFDYYLLIILTKKKTIIEICEFLLKICDISATKIIYPLIMEIHRRIHYILRNVFSKI